MSRGYSRVVRMQMNLGRRTVWKNKTVATNGRHRRRSRNSRGQPHFRQIVSVLGSLVMGGQAYVSFKHGLISENDEFTNEGAARVPAELRINSPTWQLM
jgi:hypothetical protein